MDNYDELDKEDKDFCYACDGVVMYAEQEFKKFWDMLDLEKPKACKEALLLYVPLLAEKCAGAGSALSKIYLNQKSHDLKRPELTQVERIFDKEKFTKSIDYYCRELFDKW